MGLYFKFSISIFISFLFLSCNSDNKSIKKKQLNPKNKYSIQVGNARYEGPEKYMYYHAAIKHGDADLDKPSRFNSYKPGYKQIELEKALKKINDVKYSRSFNSFNQLYAPYAKDNALFIERGPYNAPGRTRAFLVDASDLTKKTWLAGSVGGGVWKTSDGGKNWVSISSDMDNIAISWLGQSPSNPDVIYAGTGENWIGTIGDITGAGIFKSTNGGENWSNVSLRDEDGYVDSRFSNISRLLVDPNNSNIIIISTVGGGGSFIFKTLDGGTSWSKVYQSSSRIQQIISAPSDFNIQYAAVRGQGVLKSVDAGTSWYNPGGIGIGGTVSLDDPDGIFSSGGGTFGRLELAVSHQNSNTVYAGIDGDVDSYLRVSYNGGTTWNLLKNVDNSVDDWLVPQGWFDNTITVNPFNDSIVYYGGRDASKATVLPDAGASFSGSTIVVTLNNLNSHMNLLNIWGGSAVGSGTEWQDNSNDPDEVNIEIRFGPGKKQKAYRFSVPEGASSGVAHSSYSYQGFVEVPFEVWNISSTPEQQITVSFRDNNNDGEFNIVNDYTESREYIFPQIIPYDPNMNQSEIIGDGTPGNSLSLYGQLYKTLYLLWPYSPEGVTWNSENIPESSIKIEFIDASYKSLKKSVEFVTDQYDNGGGETLNQNVHVDHHNIGTIVDSENDSTFILYITTDGGVYYTISEKDPGIKDDHFHRAGVISDEMFGPAGGYNTTQFYGADKVVGFDQFIGGAQDNGTFISPREEPASLLTNYYHPIGGDGFEVVAHFSDPDKMFGGYQGNGLYYTHDAGESWSFVGNMLSGSGPFINRVSTSYQDPDLLVTLSNVGIDKSSDFGISWEHTPISGTWSNSFWDGADVEVSLANPRFIWAGGEMSSNADIFLSRDWGKSFDPVNKFEGMGLTSGIYSHPTEDSTAYLLFGISGKSKIIETKDLGQTWSDISGFSESSNDKSINGFPDVAVFSLLVMPHDSKIIWAGTEIGLFETTNRGASWHKVEGTLPNVTIWDMKIKDQGQVVFATHGRGIWTATLEDLKNFIPNPITLPPVILEAYQTDNNENYEILTTINLRSEYDSIEIYANDELKETLSETLVEESQISFYVEGVGDYKLQVISYVNGLNYPSNIFDISINPILDARSEFGTTFSDLLGDEFYLDRFRIGTQGGFEGRQLHTEHPYESGVDGGYTDGYSLHAMLNIPIIVSDFSPSIKFNEIVIVEPGEPGSSFGSLYFWDYVIVEASKDGITWKALIDGYDSDSDPAWRAAYNSNSFGSPDLIRSREINFQPHFVVGDTVKVRFRLFSDDLTTAWGWMIDDLYIQKDSPIIQGAEIFKLNDNILIYPNPTKGDFVIKFDNTWIGEIKLEISDLIGRSIKNTFLSNSSGSSSHKINFNSENDGIYLLKMTQGEKRVVYRLIKE